MDTVTLPRASPARSRVQRRRERALALGLCTRCCTGVPTEQKRICDACNAETKIRVAKMRERKRERKRVSLSMRDNEASGDSALTNQFTTLAQAKFEKAFEQSSAADDKIRLSRKIAQLLYCSARPDYAFPWYERALASCLEANQLHTSAKVHIELASLRWLESKTPEALTHIETARELAAAFYEQYKPHFVTGSRIFMWLGLRTTQYLTWQGRHRDALHHARNYHRYSGGDPLSHVRLLRHRGILQGIRGEARQAFSSFECALDVLKDMGNRAHQMVVSSDYADRAIALGRLDLARAQYERALFIARERGTKWRVPLFGLQLAGVLTQAGDYVRARNLLANIIAYDTETPLLRVLRSIVTFQLGLATRDNELLKRASDEQALEFAFQSAEPRRIGPLVAAHVKLAVLDGNIQRAKQLVARGMAAITQADHAWELLALAAQYGTSAHVHQSKSLFLERTKLPHGQVTKAYLDIWETCAALKRKDSSAAQIHAKKAAQTFARLGWKCQEADAFALLSEHPHPHKLQGSTPVLAGISGDLKPMLTDRQQQVADLVLQGLSNRDISKMLAISEHTVESHMTSILNRFGLQSRWQLAQFLE